MSELTGRVAIVTGAAQGAGGGCALALASAGASLVLAGRTLSKLESMAAAVEARGAAAHCIAGDITDPATIAALVAGAVQRFGRIDVLVNAAQAPEVRAARLLDIENEAIAELWHSGPVATLALMRACHPVMRGNGGGSIINFASGALRAPADYGVYASCKAAIETLSRTAAVEWGPDNIRVNTVVPFVMSPALERDMSMEARAQVGGKLPLGRIGRPEEDIGRAVAFLAGDAATYVTGNLIKLDGGGWNQR